MNLEALKQTLESLDINPDKIEDEIYAKVFRILFAIIPLSADVCKFSQFLLISFLSISYLIISICNS
jgi:hypothetical protein